MPLTKETLEQIEQEAGETYPHSWEIFERLGYIKGATANATKSADREAALISLLRFADCPDILIENPTLIKGKKATDEDMAWAKPIIQRHLSYEAVVAEREKIALEAFNKIAAMKRMPGETNDTHCFNRCWNIAMETLEKLKAL